MILLLHILLYIEESQQFKLQFLPFSSSRLKFYLLTENLSLEALQNAYIYCFVVVQSPNHVWLFVTAWTAAGLKLNSSPSTNCSLFPSLFQPFLPFSSFLLSLLKWIIYAAVKKKLQSIQSDSSAATVPHSYLCILLQTFNVDNTYICPLSISGTGDDMCTLFCILLFSFNILWKSLHVSKHIWLNALNEYSMYTFIWIHID